MQSTLELAEDVVHLTRGPWHLFFRSATLDWALTNEIGADIITMIASHKEQKEIILEISTKYGFDYTEVATEVKSLIRSLKEVRILLPAGGSFSPAVGVPRDPRLSDLYLHLTTRCNLRCTYCYNRPLREEKGRGDLPLQVALKALREAKELDVHTVLLTGGEPLLHPEALRIAELSRRMGFRTVLLTNGLIIDKKIANAISQTCDQVTVSLDSTLPEPHDLHRGKGTHQQVIEAIGRLKEAGVKEVVISGVLSRQNQQETYTDFEAFAKGVGADRVVRQLYILQGDVRDTLLAPDFNPILQEMNDALEKTVTELTGSEGREKFVWRNRCGAAFGVIAIDADGTIYPCQGLMKEGFAAGNLATVSLIEAFKGSSVLEKVREITVADIPGCRDCTFRHLCGGGCRALAYNVSHSLTAPVPEPYCAFNQILSEAKLWGAALSKKG
ncbi:radical SAM protein [Candidatus Bipolaricaulota bacterium]|nr:radical SAM protein [Candidatus Bipolaricaulota bacterium]